MTLNARASLRARAASKFGFLCAALWGFGAPKGICYCISDWCLKTRNNFFPAKQLEESTAPEKCVSAAEQMPAVPAKSNQLFTAVIPNGRVFGKRTVVVLNSENEVFEELSAGGSGGKVENNRIFSLFLLPKLHVLNGSAAVLAAPSADVYYHWLFDLMPRLEILRRCDVALESIDFFIVNGQSKRFQSEIVHKIQLHQKIISLEEFPHVKASRLLVPSFAGKAPDVPKWVCDFLRKTFLPTAVSSQFDSYRKIYVSRANASRRFITNEPEVKSALESAGFVTVFLEDLSFEDQVSLFAQAEIVVGSHGSGLANLVFCRPGTKIVEIFPPNRIRFHFRNISRWVGLDYIALMGDSPKRFFGLRTNRYDITVDLPRLREMVK